MYWMGAKIFCSYFKADSRRIGRLLNKFRQYKLQKNNYLYNKNIKLNNPSK
jgi:hypothetical protein